MNRRVSWMKRGVAGVRSLGGMALVAAASWLLPSCNGTGPGLSPCDGVYAGMCGATCFDDAGCPDGLYCGGAGTCAADCTPGGFECGFSGSCSEHGRCGTSDGDGFGGPDGEPATSCADIDVTFDRVTPTVVLLIDQSGSMTADFGGGNRWDVLEDALMNPQTGFVKTLEDEIRFGLALYTSHNGFEGGTCPRLTEVSVALGNYEAIQQTYAAAQPDDDTPTGASVAAVAKKLSEVTEPGPKVIVLATDGEPDTCAEPDPQNGQGESIAAAQEAFALGIKTYVVSVGDEVGLPHLQDMANAGAGLDVGGGNNAPFFQALDQQALIDAFATIIEGVRSCVFTLNGEVTGDPAQGAVTLDGEELAYDDPNGWKLNNPSEIQLLGEACEKIQDGEHNLKVTFPCGTVTTDVK